MIPTRFNSMGLPPYRRKLNYLAVAERGQYIATDYLFDSGSELEIKFYIPSDTSGNDCYFGARSGNNALYSNITHVRIGDSYNAQTYWNVCPKEQDNVFVFRNGKFSVNGSAETDTGFFPVLGYAFDLFTMNNSGNHTTFVCSPGARIYYCRFFESGTLVRNLIPVLDKSGVPCLFDMVTRTFFQNAGTGTFNYA